MIIRTEREQDHDAISAVTTDAFATIEHSSQTEAAIIAALRDAGALRLSFVAEERDRVIGHIAFSPVKIGGKTMDWFGLGPVSVHPDRQGSGIGSALIRKGLDQLRTDGAGGCVVLGNPDYYRRFGFENDERLRYEPAPPEYFMRLAFGTQVPTGRVDYHPGFESH